MSRLLRLALAAFLVLLALVLVAKLYGQEPPIQVLTNGPIYAEWGPPATEAADCIVGYELMTNKFMPWTAADVTIPAASYRWQIPPAYIWVDTFDLGIRARDCWNARSAVVWTTFKVVAAVPGVPTLPQNLKVGPPPVPGEQQWMGIMSLTNPSQVADTRGHGQRHQPDGPS